MTHPRVAIRAAIKAALSSRTALTTLVPSARIFTSRYKPLTSEAKLPAIRIFSHSDEVDEDSWDNAPREYERSLMCSVEVLTKSGGEDLDQLADTLDAICWEVEKALGTDHTLSGNVTRINLKTTNIEANVEAENALILATMIYVAEYAASPDMDPAELDNFDEAPTAYSLAGTVGPNDDRDDNITGIY